MNFKVSFMWHEVTDIVGLWSVREWQNFGVDLFPLLGETKMVK